MRTWRHTARAQQSALLTWALLLTSLTPPASILAQSSAVMSEHELAWELASERDDPANLKRERCQPDEGAPPLPADTGRAGLEQTLRRLSTRASLLMIVAHPDDEDGGMLTYESRGQGVRVGMLTLTRGEGGQNFVTSDFDDALGLVRTRELLAADRYLAVDQMFGTEVDFGFSKTIEEAFSQWTHQRVLYDAVRAVRLYRPLVVASVFIGGITDGHGQHQVSGETAQEVFRAAADPTVFPEMHLPPWQVLKVYARVPFAPVDERGMYDYATGKYAPARFYNYVTHTWSTKIPPANVIIPEGTPDPLLGVSYLQFARMGLALQRTQIAPNTRVPPPGRADTSYSRYGAVPSLHPADHEATLFDGIDISLAGLAQLAPSAGDTLPQSLETIAHAVSDAQAQLSATGQPDSAALALRTGLLATRDLIITVEAARLPDRERYDLLHELRIKQAVFEHALTLALGLSLRAEVVADGAARPLVPLAQRDLAAAPSAVIGQQSLTVQVEVSNGSREPLRVADHTAEYAPKIGIQHGDPVSPDKDLIPVNGLHDELLNAEVHKDAPLTRPYFTRPDTEQPFYDILDPRLRNAPVTPPALTAWETVTWNGVPLHLGAVVQVASPADAGRASSQPLTIVPPLSVAVAPRAGIIPDGEASFPLHVQTHSNQRGARGSITSLDLPARWTAQPIDLRLPTGSGTPADASTFTIHPANPGPQQYTLTAVVSDSSQNYREGYRLVGYPGIIRDALYETATYRVRGVDLQVPSGLKVAYLPGTGDAVEATFAEMGIASTRVSVADIAQGRLSGFDALVLGVRAYAAHSDLPAATPKLLDFARAGGVVVVQYNLTGYAGSDAPYPLSVGSAEKVVEERAPVHLLDPGAQVLRWPNRITPRDFDGWVEERGHGFLESWDPHFAAVTEVHDAGQDPQRGGLLVAPVGRGAYVYCAFALYRQMPAGVPGAFRLMANLLSLGRHPDTATR